MGNKIYLHRLRGDDDKTPKCKLCSAHEALTKGVNIPKLKMAMYPIDEIKRLYSELAELRKLIGV
ncbi:MAG: hypothetical protein A2Z03_02180 [Chloroflexi bacterium RBG_16_56_8]|nr:MAG: hypothetical protein A2Z03_02180 [Chloroflexi bacterium RBG_16_56_8]